MEVLIAGAGGGGANPPVSDRELDKAAIAAQIRRCGASRSLLEARRLHRAVADAGGDRDRETYLGNLLVQMYGNCGSLDDAAAVFDRLERRNVFSWSIWINAHIQNGRSDRAAELLRYMDLNGIKPDAVTFVSILSACSNLRSLSQGKEAHSRIAASGLCSGEFVANALINMYRKCGAVEEAREFFEKMDQRNVISWSTMVAAYAQRGDHIQAMELFERMEKDGIEPNEIKANRSTVSLRG